MFSLYQWYISLQGCLASISGTYLLLLTLPMHTMLSTLYIVAVVDPTYVHHVVYSIHCCCCWPYLCTPCCPLYTLLLLLTLPMHTMLSTLYIVAVVDPTMYTMLSTLYIVAVVDPTYVHHVVHSIHCCCCWPYLCTPCCPLYTLLLLLTLPMHTMLSTLYIVAVVDPTYAHHVVHSIHCCCCWPYLCTPCCPLYTLLLLLTLPMSTMLSTLYIVAVVDPPYVLPTLHQVLEPPTCVVTTLIKHAPSPKFYPPPPLTYREALI